MSAFEVIFLSIPFYFLWNYFAPVYAAQLPPVYVHIPFWHCVGLFAIIAILRALIFPPSCWHWKHRCDGKH